MSPLGDINGDGVRDIVLSSDLRGSDEIEEYIAGHFAEVLFGERLSAGRMPLSNAPLKRLRLTTNAGGYPFFRSSAAVGDVDEDDIRDSLLGFPELEYQDVVKGSAYLVYGSPSLNEGVLSLDEIGASVRGCRFVSTDPSHRSVGSPVQGIGDFDGDRRSDFVIGVSSHPPDDMQPPRADYRGQVFVVFGDPSLTGIVDLSRLPAEGRALLIEGPDEDPNDGLSAGTSFGLSIHALHDIDGDGLADFSIADERNGYIIYGHRPGGGILDLHEILNGETYDFVTLVRGPNYQLTRLYMGDVAGLGDLNGDGLADLAIGVAKLFFSPVGTTYPGRVYLLYGRDDLGPLLDLNVVPLPEADVSVFGTRVPELFGGIVVPAGDVNGDTIPDLAIPSRGSFDQGDVTLLYGNHSFQSEVHLGEGYSGIHLSGETSGDTFGRPAVSIGDFNGDGTDDFALLATHPFPLDNDFVDRLYLVWGERSTPDAFDLYRVEPPTGVLRGGTSVRIRGKGLTAETKVLFGGRELHSAVLRSGSEISGITPPGGAIGNVVVEARRGGDVATLPDGFSYGRDLPDYDLRDLGTHGLVLEGDLGLPGSRAFTFWSASAMAAGDFDADGVDDLVVESTVKGGWLLTMVHGGPELHGVLQAYEPGDRVTLIKESESGVSSSGENGCYVTNLQDVNGDGLDDLGIGTWHGRAYVLFGSEALRSQPELILDQAVADGVAAQIDLGLGPGSGRVSLCGLGDTDRNGIAELSIGHELGNGEFRFVEVGDGWSSNMGDLRQWTRTRLRSASADLRIGRELIDLGDMNGDRNADYLVPALVADRSFTALVLWGDPTLHADVDVADWIEAGRGVRIRITAGFEHLQHAQAAKAGDVNGDGYRDLLIGIDGGGDLVTQGAAYVVYGAEDLPAEILVGEGIPLPAGVVQVLGEGSTEQAGRVGAAGDFDGDGFDDFLVGGPGFQSVDESGSTFLVFGGAALPARMNLRSPGSLAHEFGGQNTPGGSGFAVGSAGDLNGDGEPDFAFSEIGNPTSIARVYVIYGPFAAKPFRRGDPNADGLVDISDAIGLLAFLFSGGSHPLCMDGADADDDGVLSITDPIRILTFLFLGAAGFAPPFPALGQDPTEDELDCRWF